ncbi:MAG: benzoyl-CoA reductase subunit A, partial [bacterium]|nr:benzoyl-CoA reductase subunit A [bacterium]
MKYCVGIDLGSTTTKAVILGEPGEVLGRGITNSRSNYTVACNVALGEALINARFAQISAGLETAGVDRESAENMLTGLELGFREQQYLAQLAELERAIGALLDRPSAGASALPTVSSGEGKLAQVAAGILQQMVAETGTLYARDANRKSDFFRDLAGSRYLKLAEAAARTEHVNFDRLAGLFDKAILEVENLPAEEESFAVHATAALAGLEQPDPVLGRTVEDVARIELEKVAGVGTGYGRRTLPFPDEMIRSEILCHGLGAHAMFPDTRTVL